MKTYAGIDLHSSNNYLGILNERDRRLFSRRLPNCTDRIVSALKSFRKTLTGIAVESTYSIEVVSTIDPRGEHEH